jgi:hypothetical protein
MSHHSSAAARAALALGAAAALVTALVAPASPTASSSSGTTGPADRVSRVVLHDPSGDVWMSDESSGDVVGVDAPDADVLSAHVVHARHQLRFHLVFDDLRQVTTQHYAINIVTSAKDPSLQLSADADNWGGDMFWVVGRHEGAWCPDATHAIDYDADTVDVTVPRTCLGRPDTVQAYLWNYLQSDDPAVGEYADNPHSTKYSDYELTPRLHRQPAGSDPATGYQVTLTDAAGDVKTEIPWYRPAPDTPGADTVHAVAAFRVHAFVVRVQLADLQRLQGRQDIGLALMLSGWKMRVADLAIDAAHPHGRTMGMDRCDRLGHRVSYADDLVQLTIPRACLPRDTAWVRVVIGSSWWPEGIGSAVPEYVDNPHNTDAGGGYTHRLYRPAS